MKQKMIEAHMKVAETYAQLSTAQRLKVGAIVVKDNRVISIGYNGMPSGWTNECEDIEFVPHSDSTDYSQMKNEGYTFGVYQETAGFTRRKTKPEVLHAETNAIAKLARSSESGKDSVMFITHAPCLDCAKLIYQSGISKIYYRNQYRNTDGIIFLQNSKIGVEQI